VDAEALKVVDWVVQAHDFDFTAVAGAGVDLADMQRTPQDRVNMTLELVSELMEARGRRGTDFSFLTLFQIRTGRDGLIGCSFVEFEQAFVTAVRSEFVLCHGDQGVAPGRG
jgi:hypothetical protein